MRAVLASLLVAGCGPTAMRPRDTSPSVEAPRVPALDDGDPFTPGALSIAPSFSTLQYSPWAGAAMQESVLLHGFSADSSIFAHCREADWVPRFTRACWLLDSSSGKSTRVVVSKEDYGGGHSGADASLAPHLAPLGIPAKGGSFRYGDLALSWSASNAPDDRGPRDLTFRFREKKSGVELAIAKFHGPQDLRVFPRDARLSPDGAHLALVVYVIGGPPVTTAAQLVSVHARASETYQAAGEASGDLVLLQKAVRADRTRAAAWYALARAYGVQRDQRVRDALEQSITREPSLGARARADGAFAALRTERWFALLTK